MAVQIVPRNSWARTPKNRVRLTSFDHGWFIHWLGTPAAAGVFDVDVLRQTQAYHMDTKRWSDIAYSFAIGRQWPERVYELRGWGIAGGHTEGYNSESMALVFLLGEGEKPTSTMLNTAREFLLGPATEQGYPPTLVRPHNAVRSTACPGPELTAWAKAGLKPTGGATVPTPATENPYPAETAGALELLAQHAGYVGDRKWFGPDALAALHRLKNRANDLATANATSSAAAARARVERNEAMTERDNALTLAAARLHALEVATEETDRLKAEIEGLTAAGASYATELAAARAEVQRVTKLYDGPAVQATVRQALTQLDGAKSTLAELGGGA